MTGADEMATGSLLQTLLLVAAVAAYVIGAMFYTRVVHAGANRIRRFAFIISMLSNIVIFFSAVTLMPWVVYLYSIYVSSTIYGWVHCSREVMHGGGQPTGVARSLRR